MKSKRLTKRMIIEDGYDDDLFDLLDHIDDATGKNILGDEYQKFNERINKDDLASVSEN